MLRILQFLLTRSSLLLHNYLRLNITKLKLYHGAKFVHYSVMHAWGVTVVLNKGSYLYSPPSI